MTSAAPNVGHKSNDGFILVAVLWILGGLAVLAAIYALYVVNAATSLDVNNDRIQADASVLGALELTAYYLGAVKPQERPSSGSFNFRVGSSNVAVEFVSEAARIDLNSAPKEMLAGLFRVLGAPARDADYNADRVVGWRTPAVSLNLDADQGNDKETRVYRNAGLTYNPRLAPFANAQELWLVAGLPPVLVERAMRFVTVFSGLPAVNVMDAAPEVIRGAARHDAGSSGCGSQATHRATERCNPGHATARSGAVRCDDAGQQRDQGYGPCGLAQRSPY